jgi:hypothetical protein
MYNYEKGIKGNNVGYAKIEIRNSQCKITIHIRLLSISEKQLNVYVFHRENGSINCISLGSAMVKNGVCECRIVTKTDDMMESGYSFDEMGGLLIYASKEKYFGTEWDDKPIDLDNVDVTINKVKNLVPLEEIAEINVEVAQVAASSEPAVTLEETMVHVDKEPEPTNYNVEAYIKEVAEELPILDFSDLESEEILAPIREKTMAEKLFSEKEIAEKVITDKMKSQKIPEKNRMDQVFIKYPKMYPFEDDEILDCVRIEPQDIGIFPMEYWVYANNSFLLHSYYSYRHLIFAKKKQGNREEYLLGVPGIYHNREQFMARMFGFPNFKSIKNRELKAGEFGYWFFNVVL